MSDQLLLSKVIAERNFDGLLTLYTNFVDVAVADTVPEDDGGPLHRLANFNDKARKHAEHLKEVTRDTARATLIDVIQNVIDADFGNSNFTVLDLLNRNTSAQMFTLVGEVFAMSTEDRGNFIKNLTNLSSAIAMLPNIKIAVAATRIKPTVYYQQSDIEAGFAERLEAV